MMLCSALCVRDACAQPCRAPAKGSFFFTDADLAACTAIRPDATGKAVLQVLRHAGVLREVRGGGVTRYIVCTPEAAE
jgi:hypothetical protein